MAWLGLTRSRLKVAGAVFLAIAAPCAWAFAGAALVTRFEHVLRELGGWAQVFYAVLGTLAIALCAPASLIYLSGGMVFGVLRGLILGCIVGTLGSGIAFWVARSVLGARAARVLARSARLDRFERALSARPAWLTMLLRLSLFIPIGPLSYALGLSRVPTRTFIATSWALTPAVLTYAYAGQIAGDALGSGPHSRQPWQWALLGIGLLATVAAAIWIGRAAARALARDAGASPHTAERVDHAGRSGPPPSAASWLPVTPGDRR